MVQQCRVKLRPPFLCSGRCLERFADCAPWWVAQAISTPTNFLVVSTVEKSPILVCWSSAKSYSMVFNTVLSKVSEQQHTNHLGGSNQQLVESQQQDKLQPLLDYRRENMIALMIHTIEGSFWVKCARRINIDVASLAWCSVNWVSAFSLCWIFYICQMANDSGNRQERGQVESLGG